ncbi:hypothetical protein Gogos_003212 [Gossypium gossypioides]|uniref:Uncharacterized protein n=1 Tax=Gossypium gossypioides TaxID=34282 RepID=A0A7J9CLV5_GOSGO|nr:hypothetical protein [Gossypium gossypioides]
MKHARGLKTLCQHLRVLSRLKIILH